MMRLQGSFKRDITKCRKHKNPAKFADRAGLYACGCKNHLDKKIVMFSKVILQLLEINLPKKWGIKMHYETQAVENITESRSMNFILQSENDLIAPLHRAISLNIPQKTMLVYLFYCAKMGSNRQLKLANLTVATALGIPERTVQRANEKLVAVGLITRSQAHRYATCVTTICDLSVDAEVGPEQATDGINDALSINGANQYVTADVLHNDKAQRIKSELTDLNQQLLSTDLQPMDRHGIMARIGQLEAALKRLSIDEPKPQSKALNAPPTVPDTPPVIPEPTKQTRLTKPLLHRLSDGLKQIPNISAPQDLVSEIIWSIEHGTQRKLTPLHAVNAALKFVRDGRWRTPYGYSSTTLVSS